MNLTTKVPLGHVNEQTAPAAEKEIPAAEKEVAPLPGWSEKMAQGILSGEFVEKQTVKLSITFT